VRIECEKSQQCGSSDSKKEVAAQRQNGAYCSNKRLQREHSNDDTMEPGTKRVRADQLPCRSKIESACSSQYEDYMSECRP
jgi:hypothetical protein